MRGGWTSGAATLIQEVNFPMILRTLLKISTLGAWCNVWCQISKWLYASIDCFRHLMTTFNFKGLPDCFVRMIRFFVILKLYLSETSQQVSKLRAHINFFCREQKVKCNILLSVFSFLFSIITSWQKIWFPRRYLFFVPCTHISGNTGYPDRKFIFLIEEKKKSDSL